MAAKSSRSPPPATPSLLTPLEAATLDLRGEADNSASPDYLGHRKRLRERFVAGGGEALSDHEILELLLMAVLPRRDTKPLAKRLIRDFGSLGAVFAASPERLQREDGLGETSAAFLKAVEAAAIRMARVAARERPVLASWDRLIDYCRVQLANQKNERFHLLFLDVKNALIADEAQTEGTINHTAVYPRNVAVRALEHHAHAVIMVHNHPSGDPTPSRPDIEMTRQVRDALGAVGVVLHDHLVIGANGHNSFKAMGLL